MEGKKERGLFFEEVFEGLAGGVGTSLRGFGGGGPRRGEGGGGGVLLNSPAEGEKGAVVEGVFGEDALGDGLHALEAGAGVEVHALFAGVEVDGATGALAVGVEAGEKDFAAVGTASAIDGADHARSARAKLVAAGTMLGRTLFLFFGLTGVLVAFLLILPVTHWGTPREGTLILLLNGAGQ